MLQGAFSTLSSGLTMVLAFLLVLMVVVFIHELGHFLVARWCGVTVKTFSIGFGRELWARVDRRGTRWRVAAIPLGGYVKFLDDANAASMPSEAALETLSEEERRGAFQGKPVWQRAAVVFAGPLANFILAAVIYSAINAVVGVRTTPPVIDVVLPGQAAEKAGFEAGDRVVSINGSEVGSLDEVMRIVATSAGLALDVEVERGGVRRALSVTPVAKEHKDEIGVTLRLGEIGIRRLIPARIGEVVPDLPAAKAGLLPGDLIKKINDKIIESFDDIVDIVGPSANRKLSMTIERDGTLLSLEITPIVWVQKGGAATKSEKGRIGIAPLRPEPQSVGLFEAIRLGTKEMWGNITQTFDGIVDMLARRQSPEQMGGPIMMAEVTAQVVELGFEPLLRWTALISANIGFLNLLPIPILDGGHLLFYGIEAVRRRPLSRKIQEVGFQIGLALVLMLVVYVNLNDILRIGRRWLFGG
jgi:regulator of sigma E protease